MQGRHDSFRAGARGMCTVLCMQLKAVITLWCFPRLGIAGYKAIRAETSGLRPWDVFSM